MAIINFNSISGVSTVTATASVTVGDSFIRDSKVGLGTISTADRNAGVSTATGTLIYNETLGAVQVYKRNSGWVSIGAIGDSNFGAPQGINASGGLISDYSDPSGSVYRTHVFTSSGTFSVSSLSSDLPNAIEYLVVGGGGGGGTHSAAGGGAGGLRTNLADHPLQGASYTVSTGPYTVTIGAGGGYIPGPTPQARGRSGSITNFYPTPASYPDPSYIRANGGGGGGSNSSNPGADGGSGGGAGWPSATAGSGNTPSYSPPQGRPGGATPSGGPVYGSGGGGGAGGAGFDGNPGGTGNGGAGGTGVQVLISGPTAAAMPLGTSGPSPLGGYFAGGGGGGGNGGTTGAPGAGGDGGGGDGGASDPHPGPIHGSPAPASSGGGGGGGGASGGGGGGGSGIVVIRYQIGRITAAAKATGGSVSFYGDRTIHTFTSSGTFTNTSGSPLDVNYVAIGGGGGGGACDGPAFGGGGGAGGVVSNITPFMPVTTPIPAVGPGTPNAVTVTIGAGGAGLGNFSIDTTGFDGVNTTMSGPGPISVTAYKGGAGGGNASAQAATGGNGSYGSGGGGAESSGSGGAGTPGQGNPGGDGSEANDRGGGGGGAGEAGNTDGVGQGGDGVRLPSIFHDPLSSIGAPGPSGSYYVAGGGGGGVSGGVAAAGGYGGGGTGGDDATKDGKENTGSGGAAKNSANASGYGGSGIVVIVYPS